MGEKSFHIIEGEDYIYGVWKRMDEAGNRVTHFEIRVCKNDRCIQKIMQDVEKFGDKLPKVEQLLLVEDRNFDGKEDILILTEPYKEGENLRYRLYQATEEGFEDTCSEVK